MMPLPLSTGVMLYASESATPLARTLIALAVRLPLPVIAALAVLPALAIARLTFKPTTSPLTPPALGATTALALAI